MTVKQKKEEEFNQTWLSSEKKKKHNCSSKVGGHGLARISTKSQKLAGPTAQRRVRPDSTGTESAASCVCLPGSIENCNINMYSNLIKNLRFLPRSILKYIIKYMNKNNQKSQIPTLLFRKIHQQKCIEN